MKTKLRKHFPVRLSCVLLFFIATFSFVTYVPADIYLFQDPNKFTGDCLYNPYADSLTIWRKANFHAHSIAWKRITNGKQNEADVINFYKRAGYDYASISNYEKIAAEDSRPGSIDVYEHGYNIRKVHQLVIMPKHVCYHDFLWFQFLSAKQSTITFLAENSKAVILAHPSKRNGYRDADLQKLTGYNLMEVLNHSINSSAKWDVALSSGKPVWIVGDDDTHNIYDSRQTLTNWTMIGCSPENKDSLIENLKNGNAYGVSGKNAFNDNRLKSVSVHGQTMIISLANVADSIVLIGQNGIVEHVIKNARNAAYTFLETDTYIRAVVNNKQSIMYLNPIVRYRGAAIPKNVMTAKKNTSATIVYKCLLLMAWLTISSLLIRKVFRVTRAQIDFVKDRKQQALTLQHLQQDRK